MGDVKPASECETKADIRSAIDTLDEDLLEIFARRQTYVRRMAELKQHPDQAFDAERIETMVAALKRRAEALGLESDQVEQVWRVLIGWNVAFEERTIAERLSKAAGRRPSSGS